MRIDVFPLPTIPFPRKTKRARAGSASEDFHTDMRSDEILLDLLAGVLFALEPARHPAAA